MKNSVHISNNAHLLSSVGLGPNLSLTGLLTLAGTADVGSLDVAVDVESITVEEVEEGGSKVLERPSITLRFTEELKLGEKEDE